jgi:hypothetical protein
VKTRFKQQQGKRKAAIIVLPAPLKILHAAHLCRSTAERFAGPDRPMRKAVHEPDVMLFRHGLPYVFPAAIVEIEHQLAAIAFMLVEDPVNASDSSRLETDVALTTISTAHGITGQIVQPTASRATEMLGQTAGFFIVPAGNDNRFGPQPVEDKHNGPCRTARTDRPALFCRQRRILPR